MLNVLLATLLAALLGAALPVVVQTGASEPAADEAPFVVTGCRVAPLGRSFVARYTAAIRNLTAKRLVRASIDFVPYTDAGRFMGPTFVVSFSANVPGNASRTLEASTSLASSPFADAADFGSVACQPSSADFADGSHWERLPSGGVDGHPQPAATPS